MSEQLIVAGFHRSGTSMVSQLLHRAGLFLGYELLEADSSNLYGHFEDVEIERVHKRVLTDNGENWLISKPFLPVISEYHWCQMRSIVERRNAEHTLWGFKDPRVCFFLPAWKHLLPNARVLLVYRHFADSTYSLGKRESNSLFLNQGNVYLHEKFWEAPDLGLRMWLTYNNALLDFARAYPEDTMVVSLGMVQDGFPLVWAINQRWGFALEDTPGAEVFDPTVTTGRVGRQPVSDRGLIPRVEETWRKLEALSARTEQMIHSQAGG